MHFDSEDDAKSWIIENQLGRRNLTPDQFRLLLGRKYNRLKSQGKRTDLTSRQIGEKLETGSKLAGEHGVSSRTVERAGAAAEAIDTQGSPELVDAVTQGDIPVAAAATIAELPEAEQAEILDEIEVRVISIERIIDGEFAENEMRKQFTVSERLAIAESVAKDYEGRQGKGKAAPNS